VLTVRPLAAALGRDLTAWYTRHGHRTQQAPTPVVVAVATGVLFSVAVMLFAAWQVATGLVSLATDTIRTVADTDLVRTVTNPVDGYLRHVGGLPASGRQLATTWAAATIVLFVAAMAGSRGGRIGWCVMGALTVALAFMSSAVNRPVVAGLTATFWALLSLPAFARTRGDNNPVDVNPPTDYRS